MIWLGNKCSVTLLFVQSTHLINLQMSKFTESMSYHIGIECITKYPTYIGLSTLNYLF